MAAPKFASEQYVKQFFTTSAVAARPTGWMIALHAGNPGAGDDNEVADSAYARQAATFVAEDKGVYWEGSSQADVIFPAAGAGANYTVTHYSIRDAGTDECLAIAQLPVPLPVVANGIVSFPAGFIKVRGV